MNEHGLVESRQRHGAGLPRDLEAPEGDLPRAAPWAVATRGLAP